MASMLEAGPGWHVRWWTPRRLTVLAAMAVAVAVLVMDSPYAFWTAAIVATLALSAHHLLRGHQPRPPVGPSEPAEM